jgi:uncharacterized phiE125 gp8 family phage protein
MVATTSTLTLMTAPAAAETLVTLTEAKAQCNVTFADDDALITAKIKSAFAYLDGRDGILNRALANQKWRLETCIDAAPIFLPLPPTIAVTRVTTTDLDGNESVVSVSAYQVVPGGLHGSYIVPGLAWPAMSNPRAINPVAIEYTCGHPTLPEPIRQAILMMVADSYAFRESVGFGSIYVSVPVMAKVEDLLTPYYEKAM